MSLMDILSCPQKCMSGCPLGWNYYLLLYINQHQRPSYTYHVYFKMKVLPQGQNQLWQKSFKKLEDIVYKNFKYKCLSFFLLLIFCVICKCLGTIKTLNVVKNNCKDMDSTAFKNSNLIQDVTDLNSSDTSMTGISVITLSLPRRLEGLDELNWSSLYNTVPLFMPPKKVHNLHKHNVSENVPFQNANHRKLNKFNNYPKNITCSTMSPSSHKTSSPQISLERDQSDPSDFIDLDIINKSDTKSGFSPFYENSSMNYNQLPNVITSSPKVAKSINYSDTTYPKKVRERLINNSTTQLESFHTWYNGVSPIVNYKQPVLSKSWRNKFKKTFIFSQKEQDSLLSESLRDNYSKISFDESLSSLYNTEYSSQFIDTHCHLDFLFKRMEFQESYQTFKKNNCKTFPKSYAGCISIFCDPQTFYIPDVWSKILEDNEVWWSSFGCHPHFANMFTYISEELLKERLQHPKVMTVGEIGLDYSNNILERSEWLSIEIAELKSEAKDMQFKKCITIEKNESHLCYLIIKSQNAFK